MNTERQYAVVRKPAPAFEAEAFWQDKFQKISLEQFKGKYVVLFFYPLDFTFVCPTEIIQFGDKHEDFAKINCQLIASSVDSVHSHRQWCMKDRKKGGLGAMHIPIIGDITKNIARDYGCLIEEGGDAGVAFRATYIIDDKGVLRHASVNDLPVGRNADEIYRLVEAFQYTDKYGEVCPASWKPGKATMVPDPNSAKTEKFFEEEMGKQ